MPELNTQASSSKSGGQPRTQFARKKLLAGGVIVTALLVLIVVLLAARWPFRQTAIVSALEEAGGGKVEIGDFRQTYFPSPGCVAEHVTYRLGSNPSPLATVDRLTIQSNLLGLLARHISLIRVDGMHVFVPPSGSQAKFQGLNPGSTGIDTIEIHESTLEVPRKEPGKTAVAFGIHQITLHPVTAAGSIHFAARFSNPEPPGEITASGQFGPWKGVETPVEGNYSFQNADLGTFGGIAGILSSQGKFSGMLQHIDVSGRISIPDFEVKSSKHAVALNSDFKAYVNGVDGDTFLTRVSSQFSKTTVVSEGKIVGTHGQRGKTATINLETRNGRIEAILRLFTTAAQPPMAGEVSFKGIAILPPGEIRFLKKVELEGDFGISDSNFTHPGTQEKVNQLSQNAQTETREKMAKEDKAEGKDQENKEDTADGSAPPVLSDLRGHVVLKNGIATFSDLSFYVPGAHARMHGTYDLISEKIDLHGTLKMDSDLSDTAHGTKAVVLKLLDPFFKRKRGGSAVPVKIGGDYHNPTFGMDAGKASKRIFSGSK
jgi:AsmA-like C-terminal region